MLLPSLSRGLLLLCLSSSLSAQGIITTLAGRDVAFAGDGQPAINAFLGVSFGVTADSQGNIYSTDAENNLLLKTGVDGVLHVVAGNGLPGYSGDGGLATNASLAGPLAVALDSAGNLYVSEIFSHRIRKITPAGMISTFAGSGQSTLSGDGGPAIRAGIGQDIYGMVFDTSGNFYFSQRSEHVVRKIDSKGIITTVAGTGQPGFAGDGGLATKAKLAAPFGLAIDAQGNLLIAEVGTLRIRRVSPDGGISTIAGGGFFPNDGVPASTALFIPLGIAADASGNIFLNDGLTTRVRRIDSRGLISTIAGSGLRGDSGDGGPAMAAALVSPTGLAIDHTGNVYISDFDRIRRITPVGQIGNFAGNPQPRPSPDGGPGTESTFRYPWGIAVGSDGAVIVTERAGARVRRIGPDGLVSTVAGTGKAGVSPDGAMANLAPISVPHGVAIDSAGNVYFTDEGNYKVRKVSTTGIISTAAGNGLGGSGTDGVPANTSPLAIPYGIALDPSGNLYIADSGQNLIRKVSTAGIISTVAGNGQAGFTGDGGPALSASINSPSGVAADSFGNIYVADRGNLRVRKIAANGVISTVAGNGQAVSSGDGGAALNAGVSPDKLALDAAGNIYISDPDNHRIRKVSAAGIITTIAGNGDPGSGGDGGPATVASLNYPHGVALDSSGNVYIADTGNGRVRVILSAPATFAVSPRSLVFTGNSTGAATASQSVQVNGSVSGLPFKVAVSTSDGGSWLRTDLQNGTMPRALNISADPGQLQPGNYGGEVMITSTGTLPAVQKIAITFSVGAADPPSLFVKTDALSFSVIQNHRPETTALPLFNNGGGAVSVTSTIQTKSGGNWLTISPATMTVTPASPGTLNIQADPTGLSPGVYLAQVSIAASTGQSVNLPASLIVSPSQQSLLLNPHGFTFFAVAGGGVVPPATFNVLNGGDGILNWTVASSPKWLSLSQTSGASDPGLLPPQVSVRVNAAGIAPGVYYDKISISAPQAGNAPQFVSTVLRVVPPEESPGPVIQPTGLVFTSTVGVSPGSQTFTIYNPGTQALRFNSNRLTLDGNNWFVNFPDSGTVTPDQPVRIVVQPNTTNLAPGIYSGVLTVLFSDNSVRTINLLFVVVASAPGPANVTTFKARDASTVCTPTKLAPLFTLLSNGFSGPAGWPVGIALQVIDDCGSPLTSGSVVVSFTNGDPPIFLTSVGKGSWSGTWTPRNTNTSSVTVTAKAQSITGLAGQVQVNGKAQANAGTPLLRPSAIVTSAYPAAPLPLSPGSMISLFGLFLSPSQQTAQGSPLPLELAGTSVVMAGRELPLLFVSDGQVNTLIPYDMPFNTKQQLIVQAGDKLTTPELVSIAAAQPVMLTADGTGLGQGNIYVTSGEIRTLADPNNPATEGDQILIFATGLGAVTPGIDSTMVSSIPPATTNSVDVTIGGVSAQVVSSNLSPDTPGLYYVRAMVPPGVSSGQSIPVVLAVAGQTSPAVTMSIK